PRLRRPPLSPLSPYTTLFRSVVDQDVEPAVPRHDVLDHPLPVGLARDVVRRYPVPGLEVGAHDGSAFARQQGRGRGADAGRRPGDRKSTRLNSSHVKISYAVF